MEKDLREILFKDLCARLPYNVKVKFNYIFTSPAVLKGINKNSIECDIAVCELEDVKPYLFPLSSMTEEQSMELFKLFGINLVGADYIKINECTGITFFLNQGFDVETHLDKLLDWLNKNHFDYRGLIPAGAAIDATGLNIYENG